MMQGSTIAVVQRSDTMWVFEECTGSGPELYVTPGLMRRETIAALAAEDEDSLELLADKVVTCFSLRPPLA
eukprot:2653518-Rhodomonas_salina.1